MILKINNWFGRLGNNITQVKNVIQIALFYNYETIILPYSIFFNKTIININNRDNIENNKLINKNQIITDENDFFYESKIKNIDFKLFNLNIDKTMNILKNIFKIKGKLQLNDNDVVIHIRSGDIFGYNPHPSYIMPPLSYYTSILNNNKFDKIYLIAEDTYNPVIHNLIKIYPNIIFKLRNLDNDIELLLSSKNVIESFGSFTKCLLLISDNVQTIFKPSYQYSFLIESEKYKNNLIKINNINLNDYREKIFPWKNTRKQLNLMINYKI
jgi:hypothetical protein